MTSDVSRAAFWAVVTGTVGLLTFSLVDAYAHYQKPVDFAGREGMSAPWASPPRDSSEPWIVSRGIEPPPKKANLEALRAWADRHYPVITATMYERDPKPGATELELARWPQRLVVVPGVGLVLREVEE